MESLRLAYSENAYRVYKPNTKRHIVKTTETDFLDVAAVVITEEDKDVLKNEAVRAFSIPIVVILTKSQMQLSQLCVLRLPYDLPHFCLFIL